VDGVRCVPPDLDGFLRTQTAALADGWPPTPDEAAARDPATPGFLEAWLPTAYALAHFPGSAPPGPLAGELAENRQTSRHLLGLVDRHPPRTVNAAIPAAVEVGCGPGGLLPGLAERCPAGAIGLDLRLSMLRVAARLTRGETLKLPLRTEGRRFEEVEVVGSGPAPLPVRLVQGDVAAPPLEAEAYPLVAAVSLLDTVPDPLVALGQLDALVVPGGLLLLASPHSWEPHVTPPDRWWSHAGATGRETLRAALGGGLPELPHLDYAVLEEARDLPWALPAHRRLVHRFFLDVVLARKVGATPRDRGGSGG